MSLRGEELIIDGQQIDANITGSLTATTLTRIADGAMSLDLTVNDPEMALLLGPRLPDGSRGPSAFTRPGKPSKRQEGLGAAAWDRFAKARLSLDGYSFTFAGFDGQYDAPPLSCVLTFEDTLATVMRARAEAVKTSRGQDTRAEFNGMLVRKALQRAQVPFSRSGRFYSPQAGQRQTIVAPPDPTKQRQRGFGRGKKIRIKDQAQPADHEQRQVLTDSLTVADDLRAGERAMLALIVALVVESLCRNLRGGTGTSQGPLQVTVETAASITPRTVVDPRTGQVHGAVSHDVTGPIAPGRLDPRDVKGVARVFLLKGFTGKGGAIEYASKNPNAEIYEIAQAVQGSGAGLATNGQANYGPWVEQARTILDAWGGAGALHTIRESFEFRAGGRRNGRDQNYWDDSGNSAQDVNWRRFADLNVLWFVNDEWLFERQPIFTVDGTDGVRGLAEQGLIGGPVPQVDIGSPISEVRQRVFLPRWGGPPGGVFEYENMGPLTGRWLIWQNKQDLMAPTEVCDLVLRRPEPTKREPAPSTRTTQLTETRPEAGSMRDAIVQAAKKAHAQMNRYRYEGLRPYPETLFPKDSVSIVRIDCSSFATLVYKAAQAPDPNGSGYNGGTNTSTLRANGKKTSDPQPGDLAHWGSGAPGPQSHVAVYIGDGKIIGMGGNPGPKELPVSYRTADFAGYWTHDLGAGA